MDADCLGYDILIFVAVSLFILTTKTSAGATQEVIEYAYVEDGCLSEQGVFDDHDHDCYSTNSTATVRCCSDNGEYCDSEDTNGTCFSSVSTYAEAVVECEAAGMRLCAYDELVASEDDCSQDGGYW